MSKCERHPDTKVSSYSHGCPGCGAPQCCPVCCDEAGREAVTEPTRDALREETLRVLSTHGKMRFAEEYAYAAECVKRVPELEAELDKWREREAAVCPEDFGFEEVIIALRAENARLASAGRKILGAWDALDAIPPDDPRPTHEFADAFAATLEPMRDALSAAYAAATREGTDAN